ncbi:MAG: hypothetical protein U9Q66_01665 [Patescibacteria group bacterium]|nr:hypothetical protein [Patescibacteria group bacterium]
MNDDTFIQSLSGYSLPTLGSLVNDRELKESNIVHISGCCVAVGYATNHIAQAASPIVIAGPYDNPKVTLTAAMAMQIPKKENIFKINSYDNDNTSKLDIKSYMRVNHDLHPDLEKFQKSGSDGKCHMSNEKRSLARANRKKK